jgi:hypothetical protein
MPMVDVSSGVLQPTQTVETVQTVPAAPPAPKQTVETVQTVAAAPPAVRHHVVASHHATVHQVLESHHATVHHVAASASSRSLYNYVGRPTVLRVVAPVVITQAPIAAPRQALNLSGQFLCVEGCAGGQPGLAFVTQNGWDMNLVNELGQPTRAWVDWPGHIWALNWNEGAVYSPDGMTIQFDNGTVWRRNIELLVLPAAPPHGR